MEVHLLQEDGTVGDVLVDHLGRGHLGDCPLELDDLDAQDPLVVGVGVGEGHHALHALLKAGAVDQVDAEVGVGGHGTLGEMGVRVDEAGHHEGVAEVADLGVLADVGRKILVGTDGDDGVTADGDAAGKGAVGVAGEHVLALDDVRGFLHAGLLRS